VTTSSVKHSWLNIFRNWLYRPIPAKRRSLNQRTLQIDLLEDRLNPAPVPFMLADINPLGLDSNPKNLTVVGSTLFFTATDGIHGIELWKSDGTTNGTILVKDIQTGYRSSYPSELTNVNGILYFAANDGGTAHELWKSDGTAAGTVLVKDIKSSGNGDSFPHYFINVNGTLFFTANDGTTGNELWKSDGTTAGTILVKDINPGSYYSGIRSFANVNGTLLFTANDGTHGKELWKSDGTSAGTVLVKDINPGPANSCHIITNVNDTLYFRANDGNTGQELWKSNGTTAGTVLVKDIQTSGYGSSYPCYFTNVNGIVYFQAIGNLWKSDGTSDGTVLVKDINDKIMSVGSSSFANVNGTLYFSTVDGTNGDGLAKSDGTVANTVFLKDINTGLRASNLIYLTNVNGSLYFSANDGTTGQELWKSDSTTTNTVRVMDINSGSSNSNPSYLINVNGTLYFRANDGINGIELWKLPQTPSIVWPTPESITYGTVLSATQLNATANVPGTFSYSQALGTVLNAGLGQTISVTFTPTDRVNYGVDTITISIDVLKATPTVVVNNSPVTYTGSTQTATIASSVPGTITNILMNGTANQTNAGSYATMATFVPTDSNNYNTITNVYAGNFVINKATPTATLAVSTSGVTYNGSAQAPTVTLSASSVPGIISNILVSGSSSQINAGTYATTANFVPDDTDNYSRITALPAGDFVINKANQNIIWATPAAITPGTALSALQLNALVSGVQHGSPTGELTYFPALGTVLSENLNTLSVTASATGNYLEATQTIQIAVLGDRLNRSPAPFMLANINPLGLNSNPHNFTSVGATFFFTATDGTNGYELWKSDGTTAGTVIVKDILTGPNDSNPRSLTNVNGILYFSANDGINGDELWKSDGTSAGTVFVKDIYSGAFGSSPNRLVNLNGTLYFRANDGIYGTELWKSDGTAHGTILVKDIYSGETSSNAALREQANGILYFIADDGIHGSEVWQSDGTAEGTNLVKDIYPGLGSSSSRSFTNVNGTIYFQSTDGTNEFGTSCPALWKSDGTIEGTVLIKNFNYITNAIAPNTQPFTNFNGVLYFSASDTINGNELWKSDGTPAGTVLVKDINYGSGSSEIKTIINANGTLFFSAKNDSNGFELWKSDGTTSGTVLVKDINSGSADSSIHYITNVNGIIYFTANNGSNGFELWKSDGTTENTVCVKDIRETGSSYPTSLTNVNGTLYFRANDGANGFELWKLPQKLALAWATPESITYGTALSATQFNATANVPGTFSYSPALGTVLNAGLGQTISATFTPMDLVTYGVEIITVSLDVLKATPTLVVNNSPVTFNSFGQTATITSSTPGTITRILIGSADNQTNAGSYATTATFVPADSNNYNSLSNVYAGNFVINKATPTATLAVTNSPTTYSGSAQTPAVTLNASSVPGIVSSILVGGAASQINAGSYATTATFIPDDTDNYNRILTLSAGNFVINKAIPTATLAVTNSPVTYNGSAQTPTIMVSSSSVPGTLSSILVGGAANQTNAGSYATMATFVPTDSNNYNSLNNAFAGNFVINKATPTVTLAVSNSPVTYKGSAQTPTVTLNAGSIPGIISRILVGGAASQTNAGTYATTANFIPDDTDNYSRITSLSVGDFIINKAIQTISWATPAAITQETALSALQLNASVTGVQDGSQAGTLTYSPPLGTVLPGGTNTLSVTASATSNYLEEIRTIQIVVAIAPVLQAPALASFVTNGLLALSGLSTSDADGSPTSILSLTATVVSGTLKQGNAKGKSLSFSGTQSSANIWLAGLHYQTATDSLVSENLTLSVTDTSSPLPQTVTKTISLVPLKNTVAKVADPLAPTKINLTIQGTDNADTVLVRPSGTSTTTYLVTLGGATQTVTGITGKVLVFGFAGNDSITLETVKIATQVDAGDGNDIVVGGSAADIIFGGNGADLLIGGLGADTISGDAGNDILVDGTVALTQAGDTLVKVLTTWTSAASPTTAIYNNITARLRYTADKAARDTLKGVAGTDWFWSALTQNAGVLADILDTPTEKRRTS